MWPASTRNGTVCATSASTGSRARPSAEERFQPRPEVDPAAEVDGWLRTGEVEASRSARVWVSPERARWAREARRVVEERTDDSVLVELSFAGVDWLVREILGKPATPPCWSPRTPARPCWPRSSGFARPPPRRPGSSGPAPHAGGARPPGRLPAAPAGAPPPPAGSSLDLAAPIERARSHRPRDRGRRSTPAHRPRSWR